MLLSLQENENSSTLLPTLMGQANENPSQFLDPNHGDINLQLSLGGFYDQNPNTTLSMPTSSFDNPKTSMLKRSYFELNKFMPEEVAEIKITKEDQTLVSPLDIPIWAAQSASQNPAFQRALNTIKSEGRLLRATRSTNLRVDTTMVPHQIEGSGLQVPIFYMKNGNSVATHINNRTNLRPDMLQCYPQNVLQNNHQNQNFIAPTNFAGTSRNGTFDMQLQNWTTNGGSLPSVTPSFGARISNPRPTPFSTKWNDIPIMLMPQSPGVLPTVPTSSIINANGVLFMPHHHQHTRPFSGSASIPILSAQVANSSRPYYNSISQLENPNKRLKLDDNNVEAKLELLKQLPTKVFTEGNGKQTEGLLYKYVSNQESVIVCICHGCVFSPEEFVKHAGGSDPQNAMQQIHVLPDPN
ncbi:hypothetical protein M9H77_08119 [Catharanthus roseus]|uniref:Uncharacterized protein n=1 Tax=Catharanthus roseus TaxID=4058 RepID=A0ACC0BX30_CATRO|nr:hypothetical protein M9H77_08119 [Catharanthus roseus]